MNDDRSEAGQQSVTDICTINAPYRREIVLQNVVFESGMQLLRVRIREGRARFTILDLDAATAEEWGRRMLAWSNETKSQEA